jgi:DNA-binding CsgD family transcriptional regulator
MIEIPYMYEFGKTAKEMTTRDLRDVLHVSGTALEIKEPDEQLSVVLYLLERVFKTGNNNFYYANSSRQSLNLSRVISRGIERKFFPKFKQYYHKLDPFYKVLSLGPPATVIVRDHSKNKGRLIEYYNDFLKPQSIHHQMSIYLKSKQRFLGVLGLYRPQNANEFSPRDQAKANLLAPYLAGALENAIISEQKTKPEEYEFNILKRITQYGLSQRQAEVVFLLNKGLTNKEIGGKLFISKYTVENHLKSIFQKMNVKNRTELSYRLQQMSKT